MAAANKVCMMGRFLALLAVAWLAAACLAAPSRQTHSPIFSGPVAHVGTPPAIAALGDSALRADPAGAPSLDPVMSCPHHASARATPDQLFTAPPTPDLRDALLVGAHSPIARTGTRMRHPPSPARFIEQGVLAAKAPVPRR